jgi:uncharacterized protein involved in exopolysaccharide biosynthesis
MNRAYIARLVETYFRHRWLNLVPLLLMMIGAGVWLYLSKPEYTSQGTLYVQGGTLLASLASETSTGTGWASPAQATSDDLNSLLQSDAFIRAVIAQSDLEPEMNKGPRAVNETVKEARKGVWTHTLGNYMVQISAAHESPVIAQQLSNGVIQNYIQWRINSGSNEGATAQGYFEKLIPQYEEDVRIARQDLQAYLSQHPDPVRGDRPTEETFQIDRLQAAVQEATQRLNDAVSKAEKARLAGDRSLLDAEQTYSVIDAPQTPTEPSTSRRKQAMNVAVFILAGLLLSAVAVIGASLFDTSLRFPQDAQQKLGLPVLAVVPDVRPGRKQRKMRGEKRRAQAAASESQDQAVTAPPMGDAPQRA